jgi:murein L,D-transpeptidase YafK
MTLSRLDLRRGILGLLVALMALGVAQQSSAIPLKLKDSAAVRSERKQAAAQGKLPLPGTPDLTRLDERLANRGLTGDAAMLIRIFKAESELEVWMSRGPGAAEYAHFATYPICYWSGTLGPKLKEGDRQAPEGFYTVTLPRANPNGRRWPKALDIGFPNPFDTLHAHNGSYILIHGGCASIGCFAMTNGVHKELHKLAVRALGAGQAYIPIHVFPFRMTEQNLARHKTPRWSSFWRNLKEGYDLFERTHRPPRISVCDGRYDFEATSALEAANPGPIAVCPRTHVILQELAEIKSHVAVQNGPIPSETKMPLALVTAYLGWTGHGALAKQGTNFQRQLAPKSLSVRVSPILTRPLPCSLALASCRKYAAMRERLVHEAVVRSEIRVIKKKRSKKHRHRKKKRRRH